MPLIVAANRDEFHARPATGAHWWPDRPDTLGGRDQQAGGTWLAINRDGRFATVTNFRDADQPSGKLRSRGHLIADFLASDARPSAWLAAVDGEQYAGFNLVAFADGELGYLSNRGGGLRQLDPGVYGLANATLDTPWVKVERSKAALLQLIDEDRVNETSLLHLLADREKARVSEIDAGVESFAEAHTRSAPFIVNPDFGTRCSTVIQRDGEGRVRFAESRFGPDGSPDGRSNFGFVVSA